MALSPTILAPCFRTYIVRTILLVCLSFAVALPAQAQEGSEDEYPDTLSVGAIFEAEAPDISLQIDKPPAIPMGGQLRQGTAFRGNEPGVGYDAAVNWQKSGPTGFGYFPVVDVAGIGPNAQYDPENAQKFQNGGSILVAAGKEGWGGLWRKNTEGGATGWVNIGLNLPAPRHIVEAAMNPNNQDHILAIIPSDQSKTELLMYETTDGGQTWQEVSFFSRSANKLNDEWGGVMADEDGADIHFFENGNIFVYNYDGASWGYYYDDNQDSWGQSSMPSISGLSGALARKRVYFSDQGNGLLNPADGLIFKTTDYGQTWTQIDDLSGEKAISFAISEDGQTIYELYKQRFTVNDSLEQELNNKNITQGMANIFQNNGANLAKGGKVDSLSPDRWKVWNGESRWIVKEMDNDRLLRVQTCCYLKTSTDGGTNFSERELSKPFPARGPQGLLVDPDNPSHLTAFIYMVGPYFSRDGGQSWKPAYYNRNVNKKVWANAFYQTHSINNNGTSKGMPKPTDFRDHQVMDGFPNNPILVGSDQGLHVISHPNGSISPVSIHNIAAQLDFSQAYDVEVDDCGNLYHGLWHHSALIREAKESGSFASDDLYFFGEGESNSLFIKSKSNCMSWASMGEKYGGVHDFKSYATTSSSGGLEKEDPGVRLKFLDHPVFYDNKWYYVNRSDWNLRATPLDSTKMEQLKDNDNLLIETNVRNPQKDRATNSLWYATNFGTSGSQPEDRNSPNAHQIIQIEQEESSPDTSLDLTGSRYDIQNHAGKPLFDVHNNRIITVVDKSIGEQILIYEHQDNSIATADTLDYYAAGSFQQFDSPDIHGVYADPTDPDRYFARVKESGSTSAQCPFHFMVTENSGQTWQVFSRRLNCTKVTDVAINAETETIYASTRSRGIFQANLGSLDNTTDLRISLACDEEEISETGANDCTVDFNMDGPAKKTWEQAANSVQINIEFNFDPHLYTLRTSDKTLRQASCFTRYEKTNAGFRNIKRLECTSALDSFPMQSGLPIKFKMDRSNNNESSNTIQLNAEVKVNNGEQDLIYHNDKDSVQVTVHNRNQYSKDKYDPAYSDSAGKVVGNDELSDPAVLSRDIWSHIRHFRCEDYRADKNCARILTSTSSSAPDSAKEYWVARLAPMSLPSSNDEDYYKVPLPEFDSQLMKDKLTHLECGTNTVKVVQSGVSMDEQPNQQKDEPGGQPTGQYVRTRLFTLDATRYLNHLENAKPQGYTLRKVHADLEAAFSNQGVSLSGRARIGLLTGQTDWSQADTWKIIDQGDTYVVEHDNNQLVVYSRSSQKEANRQQDTVNKTVYTRGEFLASVIPKENELAETGATRQYVQLKGYKNQQPGSHFKTGSVQTVRRNDRWKSIKVQCPKSTHRLSHLIVSVGEDDLTAGGYSLYLRYQVTMTTEKPGMQPMSLTTNQDSLANNTEEQNQPDIESEIEQQDNISLTLMGRGGTTLPGALSASDVTQAAGGALSGEKSIFSLGGSLSFGSRNAGANFRLSALQSEGALATSAMDEENPPKGTFTAVTGDLVLRPIPRILIQPYAIGGLGGKKISGEQVQNSGWKMTGQIGLGADLRLGRQGLIIGVEAVDYISDFGADGGLTHHAFVLGMVGIPLF